MSNVEAVAALTPASNAVPQPAAGTELAGGPTVAFSELIARGLDHVEQRVTHANDLVRAFALDDSVPVHQVTLAIEEARLAVELALQVRNRLVEGYREIMNMQL